MGLDGFALPVPELIAVCRADRPVFDATHLAGRVSDHLQELLVPVIRHTFGALR